MTQTKYDNYYVDSTGNVYSMINNSGNRRKTPYKLNPSQDRDGYSIVSIKGVTRKVHRLVAEALIVNEECKPQVNHINGVKTDNHIENLEWCTAKENIEHAHKLGLVDIPKGEDHHSSKVSDEQTRSMISKMLDGATNEEIAEEFGLHSRYISLIRHKKRQKHIWEKYFEGKVAAISSKIIQSKDPKVLEDIVRIAFETTKSNAEIGRMFNIDPSVVSRIRSNNKPTSYYLPYMEKYLIKENL